MNEDSILTRVERLEKENRSLRLWGAAAAGLMAAALLAAAKPEASLKAEKFILTDAQGVERARLALDPEPVLVFLDRNGKATIDLRSDPLGSSLDLFTSGRKTRLSLTTIGRNSGVTLFDAEGRPRGVLGMMEPGAQLHRLKEGYGGIQSLMPEDLADKEPSQQTGMKFYNKDGGVTWAVP